MSHNRTQYRPQSDWIFREILDGEDIDASRKFTCEFCGTRIRWIHVLEHDDYHCSVETGCCCAARLCLDYDAEATERELMNYTNRLIRFVDLKKWTRSRVNSENIWRWVRMPDRKKFRVTVFVKDGWYSAFVDGECNWQKFSTQQETLKSAFESVEKIKSDARRKKSVFGRLRKCQSA